MIRTLTALSLAACMFATQAAAAVAPRTPSEKVVVDFYNQAFNAHQPKAEEPNLLAMLFDRLNAKGGRDMGFTRAGTAHQNDVVRRCKESIGPQIFADRVPRQVGSS